MSDPIPSRRSFLKAAGAAGVVGLAGCGEPGDSEATPADGGGGADETPAGDTESVPGEYEMATAIGGSQRDPASLSAKDAVQYQAEPNDGNQCSGCTYYIPDKNGDGMGACAIVEGQIDPSGWCASYVAAEE